MGIIVDAHCDTISLLLEKECELNENNLHIDLKRMSMVGGYVQFFAAFIDAQNIVGNPLANALAQIDKLYEQINKYSNEIEIAFSYNDILRITEDKKCAGIMSIEGGEALEGSLATLRMLYKLGVRSVCLTWNYQNEIASGVGSESDNGLSDFGIEVINEMNKLGMIIDVSHLGERGFWDVIDNIKKPIIASHSNAKKICGHRRNLTDEQIIALAKNGGVTGINFYPRFLNDEGNAAITDILRHIDHIASLVGTKHIGFGSDFDGIEITPYDVEDVTKVSAIINQLGKLNYSDEEINDIAGGNFLRVIKEVLDDKKLL